MKYNSYDLIDNYIQEQVASEGFVKGLATDIGNISQTFASAGDLFSLGSKNVYPKVHKVVTNLIMKVKGSNFKGVVRDPRFLKKIASRISWRWYTYIHDNTFKASYSRALSTKKDPVPNLNYAMLQRKEAANSLLNVNSNEALVKMLSIYDSRVKMVSDECMKDPSNKGMRGLLRMGIYGLRDLTSIVRSLIAYHS